MNKIIILAALLLAACASPTQEFSAADYAYHEAITVQGMSCPNCANNITHELRTLPGVEEVRIDMGAGRVSVYSSTGLPGRGMLAEAIEAAGFSTTDEG